MHRSSTSSKIKLKTSRTVDKCQPGILWWVPQGRAPRPATVFNASTFYKEAVCNLLLSTFLSIHSFADLSWVPSFPRHMPKIA